MIKELSPYLYQVKTKAVVMVANHDSLKKCVDRDMPLWLSRYRKVPSGGNPVSPA